MADEFPMDPLSRLEAAIKGRPVVSNAYAEVSPEDVLSVCELIPAEKRANKRVEALRMGSERSQTRAAVNLCTRDIKFLIETAAGRE